MTKGDECGDPEARAAELRAEIARYDHAYYVLDDSLIGDDEYDALLDELRAIEAADPELRTPDSPTQRVGGKPVEGFAQYEHREPMLSLANARSAADLEAWEARIRNLLKRFDIEAGEITYVTEPKIDGLAISLTYEDGIFVRGTTRGDGRIGEDVSQNLRTIRSIPLRIEDAPEVVEVRGEVYFPRSGFERLNEERAAKGLSTFANPRNAAAGTIRQQDPALAAERPLQIWCYGIGYRKGVEHATHSNEITWLRERGFRVNADIDVHASGEEVVERCVWWEENRERLDYEIDGAVVKVDDRALWRDLGVVGREPRWAIAWKFPPTTATTMLNRIVWNVGRTGHMVPFAMLEPVHVGGVTVSTATLHNEEDLARKDAREGDEVIVTRAGDVIPQVIAPLIQRRKGKRLRRAKPPKECPVCGTPTVKPVGVWTICPNRTGCPGQVFQHIKHFVHRGAMDIDGFGEKQAYRFLELGLIKDAADIYDLTAEQLMELDRFAELSVRNLIASIERSKEAPFPRVLFALGLAGVGYVTAEALARHFGSIDALLGAGEEEITEVDGVGPILAEQIVEQLADERTLALIAGLRERGLKLELDPADRRSENGPLKGKTLVITGTLPSLSREQAAALIKRAGGKVTGSVSKKTDYVVAGDSPGTKLAKAEELETKILDEAGLRKVVG
ncbi:MAG: NAD-dependent DNA ligase LigA [Solirubrobacterales bacterium]|nr:NAD-dependent DNA ligase LigA [Solirubrobacterales bacterium]